MTIASTPSFRHALRQALMPSPVLKIITIRLFVCLLLMLLLMMAINIANLGKLSPYVMLFQLRMSVAKDDWENVVLCSGMCFRLYI